MRSSAAPGTKAAADRAGAPSAIGSSIQASAWTMVRLRRFLDGLRDGHRDVDTGLGLKRPQALSAE